MDHDAPTLARLSRELDDLRLRMIEAPATNPRIEEATPENRSSAENLVQYVALRRQDVRDLQLGLAEPGVSSLGRAEAQVADHQRKKSALLRRLRAWDGTLPDRRSATRPESVCDCRARGGRTRA